MLSCYDRLRVWIQGKFLNLMLSCINGPKVLIQGAKKIKRKTQRANLDGNKICLSMGNMMNYLGRIRLVVQLGIKSV